jgi:tRNA uridine 5-carboxymethylaminomethyl modification enzyme
VRSGFRILVIGGGHAGVEAAWAAANVLASRLGPDASRGSVALVTLDPHKIGVMSCNPAIGGLAKGQLVREVDAMGGVMGLATDAAGIQFKVLNATKGPAVHGPRAQCDKHLYADVVQRMLAMRPEIQVIAGSVEELLVEPAPKGGGGGENAPGLRLVGARIAGAQAPTPSSRHALEHGFPPPSDWGVRAHWPSSTLTVSADALVLTTGTFMRGLMHTGERQTPGGRFGEQAATGISGALAALGFELGRLKTGTPPRLRRGSIRWDDLPDAPGDEHPIAFSDLTHCGAQDMSLASWQAACPNISTFPVLPQVMCKQTSTTSAVHELIRANLHRAPMYSGQIESVGPRYCPSIEDKVVRFAERESHGVFLEPESLRDDWIYCNGISTSLPQDVQEAIVRAMPGCERAEILRHGYAVEYDMVRPHQIFASAMTRRVQGLYLAGQINGTSGYEEAAAQGLIAGLNAGRAALGEEPIVLGRDEAYAGVLMDDLVTKTPVEPYRMFTSRAEHRLVLRSDNAAARLTPLAKRAGLLDGSSLGVARWRAFEARREQAARVGAAIDRASIDGTPLDRLLRGQQLSIEQVRVAADPTGEARAGDAAWREVYAERRYAAYIQRQLGEIKKSAQLEHRTIPLWVDYRALGHLRPEAMQALERFRPCTFGQASRLEGITPADLTLLAVLVSRESRSRQNATRTVPQHQRPSTHTTRGPSTDLPADLA